MGIRTLRKQLSKFQQGQALRAIVRLTDDLNSRMFAFGFDEPFADGETVLPNEGIGPGAAFNAHGKEIVRRDLPKEKAYRQVYWTWTEWRGRESVEKSDVREIEYERYQREQIPAPGIEFSVATMGDGTRCVVSPVFQKDMAGEQSLVAAANVLLDGFSEFEIVDASLAMAAGAQLRRLNWELLPQGVMPWTQVQAAIAAQTPRGSGANQIVIDARFQELNRYGPNFHAIGRAGFAGYVVFGFEDRGIFALECTEVDNATYVFDSNWDSLSRLTKAEIIAGQAHVARLVHRRSWFVDLQRLMAQYTKP